MIDMGDVYADSRRAIAESPVVGHEMSAFRGRGAASVQVHGLPYRSRIGPADDGSRWAAFLLLTPDDPDLAVAAAFEVVHPQVVPTGRGSAAFACQGTQGGTGPTVYYRYISHPYVDSTSYIDLENVIASVEVGPAGPGNREVVAIHAGNGRAGAPVVIDLGLVTDHDRVTREGGVVVVLSLPIGVLAQIADLEAHQCVALGLEELHPHVVPTPGEVDIDNVLSGRAFHPAVDDQPVVDPHARTVVHPDGETIGRGRDVLGDGPADGEVIRGHFGGG